MTRFRLATPFLLGALLAASPALAGSKDGHGGHHSAAILPEGAAVPTIEIAATPDTMDGVNLHLMIENFTFSPERTGHASDAVEGHAHLYINGTKIGRVYGTWVHVPGKLLDEGGNEIRVTLNDNMHGDWMANGEAIAATIDVMYHGKAGGGHGHGDHGGHSNHKVSN